MTELDEIRIHDETSLESLFILRQEIDSRIDQLEFDKKHYKEKRAVTDKKFYMEKALQENLNFLLVRAKLEWDNLLVVDGDERAGKSNLARQIGYYIHYNWYKGMPSVLKDYYDVKNMFFDPEDVLNFAKSTRKQVIIWDEAALGALSEDRFNEVQQILIKLLMICGKYGHFLIFVLPKMKRLSPYFIEDRAIGLIRINTIGNLHRGHYSGYGKKKMTQMYNHEKGKSRYSPYPAFRGAFKSYEVKQTEKEVIDMKEYDKKKDLAISSLDFKKNKKDKNSYYLAKLVNLIKQNKWRKKREIAEYLDVSNSYISNLPPVKETL